MAPELRILHLEDEPRDTELMIAALRAAGMDCMDTRVLTKPLDVSKMLALIDERLAH